MAVVSITVKAATVTGPTEEGSGRLCLPSPKRLRRQLQLWYRSQRLFSRQDPVGEKGLLEHLERNRTFLHTKHFPGI